MITSSHTSLPSPRKQRQLWSNVNSLTHFSAHVCVVLFVQPLILSGLVVMSRTNINSDRSERSHVFVIVFFLQAVRVQDPPHGLPAAAASGLQLQEPRQGHSLERPGQRATKKKKRRKIRIERRQEELSSEGGGVTCI